jgi:hypothetical protein
VAKIKGARAPEAVIRINKTVTANDCMLNSNTL